MSRTTNMYERKATYSFLAALSDIGGFSYVLIMTVSMLLAPYSAAVYASSIATQVKVAMPVGDEVEEAGKVNKLR